MSTANQIKQRLSQDSKFWKKNGSDYLGPAPSEVRPGSDGASFHVVFDSDEFGRWFDQKTKEGGSLYTLAQKLGIPLPKRTAGKPTLEARSLADYERDKGLAAGHLAKRGWTEGKHGEKERPCIFIPLDDGTRQVRYLDGQGNKWTFEKTRPKEADDKASLAFYGSGTAKKIAIANKLNFLVWVNGAGSVEVMQQFGIPAFAVVGGEGNIARKIYTDRVLKSFGGTVFVCLDCDHEGRRGAEKLSELLGERGLVIDLGGSDGFDGADFANLWGEQSLSRLIDLANKVHDAKAPTTAHEAAAALVKQLDGTREVRGRYVRSPFTVLHQFGGGAKTFFPDLLTGVIGLSGGGKTAWWHSLVMLMMNDTRGWGFLVDSREFSPEVDHSRRLKGVMENKFSYDDIVDHIIAAQEKAEDVPSWDRVGKVIKDEALAEIKAIHKDFESSWYGGIYYAEEFLYIEDTLAHMTKRTLEIRESGKRCDIWIFDHLRLYHLKKETQESSGDNIYNVIVQLIKNAARSVNCHAIVIIQPNKTPTADALRQNRRLTITDMAFVNEVHFNTIIALNILYGTQAVWKTGFTNGEGADGGSWVIADYDPSTGKPLLGKALLREGQQAAIIEVLKNTFGNTGYACVQADLANLRWLDKEWTESDLRLPLDSGFGRDEE